jgi:hypothetical protein
MKKKELLLTLLVLLPVSAFAHGEEVLVSLFYDLLTVIALTVFIAVIKWKSNGKLLLTIVLVVSAMTAFISTGNLPYTANRVLIDTICVGVPIVSVLGTFLIFRRKFSGK